MLVAILVLVAAPATLGQGPVPVVGEFQVNTYTHSDQWRPSVATFADGGFVAL